MGIFNRTAMLDYLRAQRLAVISTVNRDGAPEGALIGVAVTDRFELIFDTTSDTRKHANLLVVPRVAMTFSGPGERTVQYEGIAFPVSVGDPSDETYREAYYAAWPDGRGRLRWPRLAYWRVEPRWARYSSFDGEPEMVAFVW